MAAALKDEVQRYICQQCMVALKPRSFYKHIIGNGYIEWHEFLQLMKSRIKDEEAVSRDMSEAFKGETLTLDPHFFLSVEPDNYHSLRDKFSNYMYNFMFNMKKLADNSKVIQFKTSSNDQVR